MKVLLDSTYFFPAIDIEITEGWSKTNLITLLRNESYVLFYADLSIFEIYAKAMKLIIQKKLDIDIESVQKGLQGILNSPRLHKLNWWEHLYETELVLKLKEIHNDSIDCTLFYLAIVNCDIFATYDEIFVNKIQGKEFVQAVIQQTNPHFKIWMGNLSHDPFELFPSKR